MHARPEGFHAEAAGGGAGHPGHHRRSSSAQRGRLVFGGATQQVANGAARQVRAKVIAEGAPIHGTNGINFGPDGNLYIASVVGREIVVMNPLNGKIIKRMGPAADVDCPDDLVFGPDGSLYWTEILIGYVGRMTPEGVVTKQFVAPGVNPITFSPDGRLFVALDFLGDGLYELDPDLIATPRPIIEATPGNPYPLGFLNGFDFGPDGRLYGPLFAAGMVISVDVGEPGDPPSPDPWTDGTIQIVATGFTVPAAAKFDSQGRLHVVDQSGEVFQVDPMTGDKTVVTILDPGLDNLAFDSGGNLYISNAQQGWIVRLLSSGQTRTISPGGMVFPGGVAVLERPDGKDAVFVANTFTLDEFIGLTGKQVKRHVRPFCRRGPHHGFHRFRGRGSPSGLFLVRRRGPGLGSADGSGPGALSHAGPPQRNPLPG
jgi:sugar lactone lactonase YvrE